MHGVKTLAEIGVMTGYELFEGLDNVFYHRLRDQGVVGSAFDPSPSSPSSSPLAPSLINVKDIAHAVAAEAATVAVNSGVADHGKFAMSAVQGALLAFRASGLHLQPGASATPEPSAVASDGVRAKPPSTLLLDIVGIFCCTKIRKFLGF